MEIGIKSKKYLVTIAMLCGLLSLSSCSNGGGDNAPAPAKFNNASFGGVWLLGAQTQGENNSYLVSDGNGHIIDYGAFYVAQSTYSVSGDGTLTVTLETTKEPPVTGVGKLTSSSDGTISFFNDTKVFDLNKVSDIAALQGSWSGTLTEGAAPNTTYNVTFSVNASGEITSLTGFSSPVSGKIFSESGKVTCFIRTNEQNSYNQIQLNGDLQNNGMTINGVYEIDVGVPFDGTFTLTKL